MFFIKNKTKQTKNTYTPAANPVNHLYSGNLYLNYAGGNELKQRGDHNNFNSLQQFSALSAVLSLWPERNVFEK